MGLVIGPSKSHSSYASYIEITPSTSSVNEGSTVTFNIAGGAISTTLYWTLNTVSGTINTSDFTGAAVSGSFATNGSGVGSVALTLANDSATEGTESFQLQVRTGSTSGTILATSSTITIGDPPPPALGSTFCGGRVFCKVGNGVNGTAWIVAPAVTEVGATWSDTSYTLVGNKPCVRDWSSLSTALTNGGLTPSQWFVPSISQLQSGYACKTHWDSCSSTVYWSSTEFDASNACTVYFVDVFMSKSNFNKTTTHCVRAFRCVTY
jgi:hypothetical protein